MILAEVLLLASGLISTTYGWGEARCGDVGHAVPCDSSAITASGVRFDPGQPMAAVAAPFDMVLDAKWIGLRVAGRPCYQINLVDKMHPRYIGVRGFDLSPAAVELLTGRPATPYWSGKVYTCQVPKRSAKMGVWLIHGHPIPWSP